jgi:predicted RNase H-like HicB family nuclease
MNETVSSDDAEEHWSCELVADENGEWIARVPELPGCFTHAQTRTEALRKLESVIGEWIIVRKALKQPIPSPRSQRDLGFSGRFSVRVPRSLHKALVEQAQTEGCSLNQLVTTTLAIPNFSQSAEYKHDERELEVPLDIQEQIAADAVGADANTVGALKGAATFLRNRGATNLAVLLYAFAARVISEGEGREQGAREAGMAASLARREGRYKLAETLFRESLRYDPTNLRSASSLGQLLHHQGRYDEAIEWLDRARAVDSYAALFHGWSTFHRGRIAGDASELSAGQEEIVNQLRQWAYQNSDPKSRESWLRQVNRLWWFGGDLANEAEALLDFGNAQSNWTSVNRSELLSRASVPAVRISDVELDFDHPILGARVSSDDPGQRTERARRSSVAAAVHEIHDEIEEIVA